MFDEFRHAYASITLFRDHKVRVRPLYTSICSVIFPSFSSFYIMALVKFVTIRLGRWMDGWKGGICV